MTATPPGAGDRRFGLDRFLDDLRRTGTVVSGPVPGEPEDLHDHVEQVEWLVTAHRGTPIDPPYRLRLDEAEFSEAVQHDAGVMARWWPGGDPAARAYEALLLSFDAALVEIDRTPHGFLLEEDDRVHLTTHHLCPDPLPHLDLGSGDYTWSAHEPGIPEFEDEQAQQARQSRHRRHTYLVLGWLEVGAAYESGQPVDAAMAHLQDQLGDAFGSEVFQRFSAYLDTIGSPSIVEVSAVAHENDDRFDALLDALAGQT